MKYNLLKYCFDGFVPNVCILKFHAVTGVTSVTIRKADKHVFVVHKNASYTAFKIIAIVLRYRL